MFELHQLEALVSIVEEGTISKAAEKLLISQPALSRTIQRLEEELSISLFDRTKNKVYINDNGHLAYQKAKELLQQADRMKEELLTFNQMHFITNLASCAPAPVWAMESIINNNLNSIIIDNSNEIIAGLNDNTYSLIVLNHYIENKDFICIEMFSEKLYLSVVPTSPLANKEHISFDELNGESVLLSSKIGFWSRLCQLNLPDSHLLYQKDELLHEIVSSSTLPSFKTDITIKRFPNKDKRIYIPISDLEATTHYFLYYKNNNKGNYQYIKDALKSIDWCKL
jgi:DNA-binding transcriptional LysR family regulator